MSKHEDCVCGCITLEEPYTYNEIEPNYYVIKYKNKNYGLMRGESLTDKVIESIISLLNEAYQNGFSNSGTELMSKAMNQNNMLEQSNIHQELICSNNDFMPI